MTDKKPKKILVVDDESDVTELLAYHLKSKGFSVETVNNPNSSVGLARTFLPDLVILDVMMPELNGIQICRMLRADPKLKRVPVIFLTAKAEENDRIQGLETGADDYICKPFSTKEVVLRVQSILRRVNEGATEEPRRFQIGQIALDADRHEAMACSCAGVGRPAVGLAVVDDVVEVVVGAVGEMRLAVGVDGEVESMHADVADQVARVLHGIDVVQPAMVLAVPELGAHVEVIVGVHRQAVHGAPAPVGATRAGAEAMFRDGHPKGGPLAPLVLPCQPTRATQETPCRC